METTDIVVAQEVRPMTHNLTPAQIKADHTLILQVMETVMKEGMDYGKIPGCGDKSTLLKPGAEKLLMTFHLAPKPGQVEDIGGPDEIRYRVITEVIHAPSNITVSYGVGEASSNEEKYRWRKAVCQEEWDETSEDRRRHKWSPKWKDGKKVWDKAKGAYVMEKVLQVRTNPSDLANTILKMADKRSVISGVLKATAASSIFTQDLEDLSEDIRAAVAEADAGTMPPAPTMPQAKAAQEPTVQHPADASKPAGAPPKTTPPAAPTKRSYRMMKAKFPSDCPACQESITEGEEIAYDGDNKKAYHPLCVGAKL